MDLSSPKSSWSQRVSWSNWERTTTTTSSNNSSNSASTPQTRRSSTTTTMPPGNDTTNNNNNNNKKSPTKSLAAKTTTTTATTMTTTAAATTTTSATSSGSLSMPHTVGSPSHNARIVVTVLSVYDLWLSEAPTGVSMKCGNHQVTTGPPTARHKDRNSFRFLDNANTVSTMTVHAPLTELYHQRAHLTVHYKKKQHNVTTSLPLALNTLRINETTWLVLNLTKPSKASLQSSNSKKKTIVDLDEDEEVEIPTVRVHVRLEGPYRPEIAAILSLGKAWFGVVDQVEYHSVALVRSLSPPTIPANVLLIPAVPLVTTAVVLSPVLVGTLVVLVPFLLPALVVVLGLVLAGSGVVGLVYASTQTGRDYVGGMVSPLVHTVLSTPSGQRLVYQTGPRPTPVSVARVVCPTDRLPKLFFSLLIDLIGSSSYLLPVVGEGFDLVWAPVQTVFVMAMYDPVAPSLKYVSFLEEILPFTDIIPSATMGWITEFGPALLKPTSTVAAASSSSSSPAGILVSNNNSKSSRSRGGAVTKFKGV